MGRNRAAVGNSGSIGADVPQGRVFDLKRFAVHDGPGIRTTVFLKGCPLGCVWCHNPEAISRSPQLFYRPERCISCLACVEVCPSGAQRVLDDGTREYARAECDMSELCVAVCNSGALELSGRLMGVEEVMEAVRQDVDFYRESKGGVTLSGGEPLLQAEFAMALLEACAGEGIHTAVDTCGQLQWSTLEAAVPFTDLFLYDLKDMLSDRHRSNTGVGNERIIENLRRLSGMGVPIEIRMVVIPGVNDSARDIEAAGELLGGLATIVGVRLLAYHSMAGSKYAALGMENTLPDAATPGADELAVIGARLKAHGLRVFLPAVV